jgi:ribosomal silencing factor RsfS
MEPLLKFASDGLGMDDLALLDLRELDPPAAIGPNLMMIFGTSRSERHLHVSADRMVRFLRRRAGIVAKADGLIGRNELKVKLRRLERKARLLGNSGAMRGGDDGISTGWVCVNLGVVGGSTQEVETFDAEGRSTGFGVPQTGTTIIIQMLTEGRRKELDLEGLWNGMLQRSLEKAQGLPVGARSTNPFEW